MRKGFPRQAGVEQSDVGCQFGGSSDRTAEIAAHLLLVNYNRSGQVLDFVHIGTGQLRKSCAGERAEGLDQLALGLGVDGVKQQRGLAADADALNTTMLFLGISRSISHRLFVCALLMMMLLFMKNFV